MRDENGRGQRRRQTKSKKERREGQYPGAGPRDSITAREERVLKTAQLDREGKNQYEIARILGVTQQQVSYDLIRIRQKYKEGQLEEHAIKIGEKIQQYRDIRKAAWRAWQQSKRNEKKTVREKTPIEECLLCGGKGKIKTGGKGTKSQSKEQRCNACRGKGKVGGVSRATSTVQGRLPANEYLRTVLLCLQAEIDLLGLGAPKKFDMRQLIIDWDKLAGEIPVAVADNIEEEIKRVEDQGSENVTDDDIERITEELEEELIREKEKERNGRYR